MLDSLIGFRIIESILLNLPFTRNSIFLCLFFVFLNPFKNNLTNPLHVIKNKVINAVVNSTGADKIDIDNKTVTLASDKTTKRISRH